MKRERAVASQGRGEEFSGQEMADYLTRRFAFGLFNFFPVPCCQCMQEQIEYAYFPTPGVFAWETFLNEEVFHD